MKVKVFTVRFILDYEEAISYIFFKIQLYKQKSTIYATKRCAFIKGVITIQSVSNQSRTRCCSVG